MVWDKYVKLFDLTGKVVLVAGGGGAIGAAIAEAAAGFGAKIAVADISQEAIDRTVSQLQQGGAEAMGVQINAIDAASVAAGVAAVEARFGQIDALVNTVGTHIEQPAEDVTVEAWDKVVDVNLKGAFLLSQGAARSMIAHKIAGSIFHITSVRSGLGIRRGYAAYCASKGGLAILIKQLATEWAKYGIRVNGIAPTFTRTALVKDYLEDPNFYNPLVARIPMGRICETSDLVGLGVYLLSDASSFLTGQNIFMDGGVTATQ